MATVTQTKLVGFGYGNKSNYSATTYANHIWFDPTNKQILLNGIEYIPKNLSELVNDGGFLTSANFKIENTATTAVKKITIGSYSGQFYTYDVGVNGNMVLAGSTSSNANTGATFRKLVEADIPALSIGKITNLQSTLDTKLSSITKSMVENVLTGNITSHTHFAISTEGDNRSVATTPNDYYNNFVYKGLKSNSIIGSPSGDYYSYLLGLRGWSDSSGGHSHELAFNNSGVFRRSGATTEWGNWYKLLDSGNYTTYAATKDHTHTFASITSKPTTLSGYGITDAMYFYTTDDSSYVAARFNDKALAQKAASTYIEFWQGSGWFNLMAGKFITNGGTSAHFLKGDGSLDSNTYALASDLSKYLPLTGGTLTGSLTLRDIYITSTASEFPSHYYHKLYSDTDFSVYEHFGTNSDRNKVTYGKFRFYDGNGSYKTLVIGGDGTFKWNGTNVSLEGHTHSYLPLTGGTLSGALTCNGDYINMNNDSGSRGYRGFFNQSAAEDRASGSHIFMGGGGYALGTNAVSIGYQAFAGIRNKDSDSGTYPYIHWQWFPTEKFTVNTTSSALGGGEFYGYPLLPNETVEWEIGGQKNSYQNTSAYKEVLVVVKDSDDGTLVFGGKTSLPYRASKTLIAEKYIVGSGEYLKKIDEYTINDAKYYQVIIYTWNATAFPTSYDFTQQVKVMCATKVNNSNYNGASSYASGYSSVASGYSSVASGQYSVASGYSSVASGNSSVASGSYSVASGYSSVASGDFSVVLARNGETQSSYQTIIGRYNAKVAGLFIIGNGSSSARSNALVVDESGNVTAKYFSGYANAVGGEGFKIYPENTNQINFGGTGSDTTIVFGAASKDSRSVPTTYKFGANGDATIVGNLLGMGAAARLDLSSLSTNGVWSVNTSGFPTNDGGLGDKVSYKFGTLLCFSSITGSSSTIQIYQPHKAEGWWIRNSYDSVNQFTAWKQIAFTDSSITGNAATATKLQTAQTLWGNSFDGTAGVSGSLTFLASNETQNSSHGMRIGSTYGGFIGFSKVFGMEGVGNFTGISLGWGANPETDNASVRINANIFTYKTYPVLHSNNFNDYVPTKTGSGASGTWDISVSGNAATATTATAASTATTASKLTDLTTTDNATNTDTWRKVWFSRNDGVTGRPSLSSNLAYQVSTNTLKVGNLSSVGDIAFSEKGKSVGTSAMPIGSLYASTIDSGTDEILQIGASGQSGISVLTDGKVIVGGSQTSSWKLKVEGSIYSQSGGITSGDGFIKLGSSDSYVLLGGGGHKAVGDFATSALATANANGLMSSAMFNAKFVDSVGVKQGLTTTSIDGKVEVLSRSIYIRPHNANVGGDYASVEGRLDVAIPNATTQYDGSMSYTDKRKLDKMPDTVFGIELDIDDASTASISARFGDYKIGGKDATLSDVDTIQKNNHYITLISFNITNDELKNKLQNRLVKFGYSSKDNATYQTMRLLQSNFDGSLLYIEYIHTETQYNITFDCIWELY